MAIVIEESGIKLGSFDEENVFLIESSRAVQKLGDGIKKVECVFVHERAKERSIVFVEAKMSIPKDRNEFFHGVKMKMLHSLMLWLAALSGRQQSVYLELPEGLKGKNTGELRVRLFLVIPNMPSEHLMSATDKLRKMLSVERRIWNIAHHDIVVLNKSKVEQMGFLAI